MRKIFGLLFAFSIIISITFLSDAISPNNPFSVKAQPTPRRAVTQKKDISKYKQVKKVWPWNKRKSVNRTQGAWTWNKGSHRTIIIHSKGTFVPTTKAIKNRRFKALKQRDKAIRNRGKAVRN